MGTGIVRTIGIVRARCKIGMTNLAYNMRRFVCLERMTAKGVYQVDRFRRLCKAAGPMYRMASMTASPLLDARELNGEHPRSATPPPIW
jgi:hypothetical protein